MITSGVLGGRWRAGVTPWGAVEPRDGSPVLDWHIAADDRWHTPRDEAAVRQATIDGTPVVETRVRIPDGDAVQRVWSVADLGGLTVVEVSNESPLPIAVAFTRGDLLSARPPASAAIPGISLPAGSVMFPIGHRASLRVALAHDGSGAGALPGDLPSAEQVSRGWQAVADRAGRFVLPDDGLVRAVTAARCGLLLDGVEHPDEDPAGFLLGAGQLVLMGEPAEPWVADAALAAEQCARSQPGWLRDAALDAASVVFARAGDRRATKDLRAMRARLEASSSTPPVAAAGTLEGVRLLAAVQHGVVNGHGQVLAGGWPPSWLGANFEVHDVPIGAESRLSLAVRWHGERPAVLWETKGPEVKLTAPSAAPGWKAAEQSGETLWPTPAS